MPVQNRISHGRQIKTIFFFLTAMILVAHLSSILLLNDVIESEEDNIRARLGNSVDRVVQLWSVGGHSLDSIDSLVAPLLRSGLVVAFWAADNQSPEGWRVRRFGKTNILNLVLGTEGSLGDSTGVEHRHAPPFYNAEYEINDQAFRTHCVARSIGKTPIVIGAVVPVPRVAQLRSVWRWDLWVRGFILLLFAWFSVQFFRLIFRPYQKMRAQAEKLSGTGLVDGLQSDDVEYVMAAFGSAVERLTRQKEKLQHSFDRSVRQYESLDKFNTYILNSMSAGVLILNSEGKILRLNPSARRILNLEAVDVVGKSCAGLRERFPELVRVLTDGLEDARVYRRREITIKVAEVGSRLRYLGITTSLIRDDEMEVVGISVLLTDLTEIKELQADLENNRRLADLGEMAAGLAHQLRNSLAAIVGFGRLLQRKITPDNPASNTVTDVLKEAEESTEMLGRFLNFARPLDIELQPASLVEIIEEAYVSVAGQLREREVAFTLSKPTGDFSVKADPLLLRQVFVNLFQNAADALERGGEVTVRVFPPVASAQGGGYWIIRVGDTGPGIPGNKHEKIFQPFYTSKDSGTGLGLPIARKIVSCHGGYLGVESSTPVGTVFLIRLPYPADHPRQMTQKTPAAAGIPASTPESS